MTIDLDDLERKARAASPYRWNNYYPGQAPKELVDLRNAADSETILALIERVRKAETSQACEHGISGPRCPECPDGVTQHWAGVRELQERVRELEAEYVAPAQWRCDGCSCIARTEDGRRPDRHESCGGVWLRQERAP